ERGVERGGNALRNCREPIQQFYYGALADGGTRRVGARRGGEQGCGCSSRAGCVRITVDEQEAGASREVRRIDCYWVRDPRRDGALRLRLFGNGARTATRADGYRCASDFLRVDGGHLGAGD